MPVFRLAFGPDFPNAKRIQRIVAEITMEIKWHDIDPETEQRRYLAAKRFAGEWSFRWKLQRRGEWTRGLEPTRAMWEYVLDGLKRRYRRREGVSEEDITQVERILAQVIKREDMP